MIKSKFILEILRLSIKDEKYEDLLFQQFQYLSLSEVEYTGTGAHISFKANSKIRKFRLTTLQLNESFGDFSNQFDKLELKNKSLNILADLTVYLTEGIISGIEIWNKLGNYPSYEIRTYQIRIKKVSN